MTFAMNPTYLFNGSCSLTRTGTGTHNIMRSDEMLKTADVMISW
jgi:hypothetical protein